MFVNKSTVFDLVEREGKIVTEHVEGRYSKPLFDELRKLASDDAHVITDKFRVYEKLPHYHETVNHSQEEWTRGNVHTNNIEGYWSQLKRSTHGTCHYVSPKYLQTYLDKFSYRYNRRDSDLHMFYHLIVRTVA